jgi:histidyl-tRNA synthetase
MLVGDIDAAKRPIVVIPVGDDAAPEALELTHRLRRDGFTVDLGYRGNLQKRMKRANKMGASAALILGDDERAQGAVTLRNLDTGEQVLIPLPELTDRLTAYR